MNDAAIGLLGVAAGLVIGGLVTFAVMAGWVAEQREKVVDRLETHKIRLLAWSENALMFSNYALAAQLREMAQTTADQAEKARNAR
jgi:hypothetical protein